MDTKSPPPAPSVARAPRRPAPRTLALLILAAIVVFLAGWLPATMSLRRAREELRATRLDLALANLHRQLGVAAVEAHRGNFVSAEESARRFFDGCRELTATEPFPNEPRTRAAIAAYASSGDSVAQQFAVSDPQVVERLSGMFLAMAGVLERRE